MEKNGKGIFGNEGKSVYPPPKLDEEEDEEEMRNIGKEDRRGVWEEGEEMRKRRRV